MNLVTDLHLMVAIITVAIITVITISAAMDITIG